MAGIADFLDSLIGGFSLICFALAVGRLFWGLFILQPWQKKADLPPVLLYKTNKLMPQLYLYMFEYQSYLP